MIWSIGKKLKDTRVTKVPVEGGQSKPQYLDTTGPNYTLVLLPTKAPRPSSARSATLGYVIISQSSLNDIILMLGIVEEKVDLIQSGMKLCVYNRLKEQSRRI